MQTEITLPRSVCIIMRYAVPFDKFREIRGSTSVKSRFCYSGTKRAVALSHVCSIWRETTQRWSEPLWRNILFQSVVSYPSCPPSFRKFENDWVFSCLYRDVQSIVDAANAARLEIDAMEEELCNGWATFEEHKTIFEQFTAKFESNYRELQHVSVCACVDAKVPLRHGYQFQALCSNDQNRRPDRDGVSACVKALGKNPNIADAWFALFRLSDCCFGASERIEINGVLYGANNRKHFLDQALQADPRHHLALALFAFYTPFPDSSARELKMKRCVDAIESGNFKTWDALLDTMGVGEVVSVRGSKYEKKNHMAHLERLTKSE